MREQQLNDIQKSLDRVISYIEDDQSTGRKGLYTMVKDIEKGQEAQDEKIRKVESRQSTSEKVKAAKVAVWSALGAGLVVIANLVLSIWNSKGH